MPSDDQVLRSILESLSPMHLRCERKEDWNTLFAGLLHDYRQRFTPDAKDVLPNAGYQPPLVLDLYGQAIYVYPPRVKGDPNA